MSPDQPQEVVLANSVLAFDGRVLELFGHSGKNGNRLHVKLVTAVDDQGETIVVTTRGAIDHSIVLSGEDEATREEARSLLAAVASAAGV